MCPSPAGLAQDWAGHGRLPFETRHCRQLGEDKIALGRPVTGLPPPSADTPATHPWGACGYRLAGWSNHGTAGQRDALVCPRTSPYDVPRRGHPRGKTCRSGRWAHSSLREQRSADKRECLGLPTGIGDAWRCFGTRRDDIFASHHMICPSYKLRFREGLPSVVVCPHATDRLWCFRR